MKQRVNYIIIFIIVGIFFTSIGFTYPKSIKIEKKKFKLWSTLDSFNEDFFQKFNKKIKSEQDFLIVGDIKENDIEVRRIINEVNNFEFFLRENNYNTIRYFNFNMVREDKLSRLYIYIAK